MTQKKRTPKKSNLKVIEFKGWPQQLTEIQKEVCLSRLDDMRKDIESGRIVGFAYVSLLSSGNGTFTGWAGEVNNDLHRAIGGVNLLLRRLMKETDDFSVDIYRDEDSDDDG